MSEPVDTSTLKKPLRELPTGKFITLEKTSPSGTLQARKQKNGAIIFYWRYSLGDKSERVPIGAYDSKAAPRSHQPTDFGFSLAAAKRAAEDLAARHYTNKHQGGHAALVATEKEALRVAEHAQKLQEEAALFAATRTLKSLLSDYCVHLKTRSKRAGSDATSIFNLHVFEPWPDLSNTPANQIESEHVANMMRRLIDLKKGRTSNKLRAYMRAAYQTAKAAKTNPNIPENFKLYQIKKNPVSDTDPNPSMNKRDKNPLTLEQMRTYWQTIKALSGFKGAALRLHLLTGGQRIEQLVNLRTKNAHSDLIILYDSKGRPGKGAREHKVPLIDVAARALKDCHAAGEYALSTDGGVSHLAATTLSAWAKEAVHYVKELEGFKLKRVRSGVETLLSAAKVSKDIRGQLQSHGISGVQAQSYDAHDYLSVKLEALEKLFAWLENSHPNKI